MRYSPPEALLLADVQKRITYYKRGILTKGEIANAVLEEFARSEVDRVIPECVAMLPSEVRACLKESVETRLFSDEPGDFVYISNHPPSAEEQGRIRTRVRVVGPKLLEFCEEINRHPEMVEHLAVPSIDRFWAVLRNLPTRGNPTCSVAECDAPRINPSIFCAYHHYEQMEGKPPPEL